MRANLEASGELAGSSAALLALVDAGWTREDAYAAVQRAAMAAWEGKGGFRDLLLAEPFDLALLANVIYYVPVDERVELLRAVAERLRGCLRSADTAARLGGDEFALLVEEIGDPTEAAHVANRLLTAMGRAFDPRLRAAARALAGRLPVATPRTGVPTESVTSTVSGSASTLPAGARRTSPARARRV